MTNEELKRKLREADAKESELSDEISELRKLNDDNYLENNNLKDRLKMVESRSSESIESLKREIEMLKRKVTVNFTEIFCNLVSIHFDLNNRIRKRSI
jgi:phage host-nuclease inhibitor protein Gam